MYGPKKLQPNNPGTRLRIDSRYEIEAGAEHSPEPPEASRTALRNPVGRVCAEAARAGLGEPATRRRGCSETGRQAGAGRDGEAGRRWQRRGGGQALAETGRRAGARVRAAQGER